MSICIGCGNLWSASEIIKFLRNCKGMGLWVFCFYLFFPLLFYFCLVLHVIFSVSASSVSLKSTSCVEWCWWCSILEWGWSCCLLFPELGDFLFPLNLGIDRIFLQFHSCIVPQWSLWIARDRKLKLLHGSKELDNNFFLMAWKQEQYTQCKKKMPSGRNGTLVLYYHVLILTLHFALIKGPLRHCTRMEL